MNEYEPDPLPTDMEGDMHVAYSKLLKARDALLLQNREMIPVVQAAVDFWKSDKGDTRAEAALYAAVEKFEEKEGNDVLLWACALKPNGVGSYAMHQLQCPALSQGGAPCTCQPINIIERRDQEGSAECPALLMEPGPIKKCGLKAGHEGACVEVLADKRVCESRTGFYGQIHCVKGFAHGGRHSDGHLVEWYP